MHGRPAHSPRAIGALLLTLLVVPGATGAASLTPQPADDRATTPPAASGPRDAGGSGAIGVPFRFPDTSFQVPRLTADGPRLVNRPDVVPPATTSPPDPGHGGGWSGGWGPIWLAPGWYGPWMTPPISPYGPGLPPPVPWVADPLTDRAQGVEPLDPGRLGPIPPAPAPAPPPSSVSRRDRERAGERLKVGDRLFRAREFVRAAERYQQSIQANPHEAVAYVRLAQVAVARRDYPQAARWLREAQVAQPAWMLNAPDVQNLFGDPRDFAAVLAELEAHLQAEPGDRDAWLVLGAELYLSGRTRRAADVFLRLTDRRPDETLAAFLRATQR